MSDDPIKAGDLIALQTNRLTGLFRVVLLRKDLALAYLYPIDIGDLGRPVDGEAPKRIKLSAKGPTPCELTWLSRLSSRECSRAQLGLPSWVGRPLETLTEKQAKTYMEIKTRTEVIAAPDALMRILSAPSYHKEINRLADELAVHRTTIARDLSRFFICECDVHKAGMFATLARRPANPQTRKVVKKLGRKRRLVSTGHLPDAEGINVSAATKERLQAFLLGVKNRAKLTPAAMHRDWKDNFVSKPAGSLADGTVVWQSDPDLNITYLLAAPPKTTPGRAPWPQRLDLTHECNS